MASATSHGAEDRSVVVRMRNVRKTYLLGKVPLDALKGVDLEIYTGEYISIMGPSGSGKCRQNLERLSKRFGSILRRDTKASRHH